MSNPTEYDKCLRCGRPLKTKESRVHGYGAVCLKKRQKLEITPGTQLNNTFEDGSEKEVPNE